MDQLVVNLSVVTRDASEATRAAEVMARAAAGLALEGISVALNLGTVPDHETEDS